ncbi:Rieske 2Fe-2S domain-containing protein [Nocardia sp. NPDC055049]
MMTEDATRHWHDAQDIDDLWEGDMVGVEIDGTKVLVVNVDGAVRAFENKCPHQAWALDEGDFDGESITCIRHMWTFAADTGAGINPDDTTLKSFPCRVNADGMIQVDVG